jgi:acetylornithine deacetylase/succinyl-diaminopimelate desuccinylase-like protein
MTSPTPAIEYARANRGRFVAELQEILAIPSVSTLSEHKPDMRRAAEWVANNLRAMGLQHIAIMPTAGHSVVYGDWLNAPGQPVVLIYGHYDVQPVEPLNEWHSGPFDPTIRGDNIYARGASDMKGQVMGFLKALDAILQCGPLPINVKVIIEGEEEIGSPHLGAFVQANLDLLQCDLALNADVGIISPTQPSLVYGLRGLAYFELWIYGAKSDLHSGTFGGSVHNPAQVLCELIAGMHDANGKITLPGFYDKVRELTAEERATLAGESLDEWNRMVGAPQLYGEKGYTHLEQTGARPTLEINGLYSGFIGEGSKTVLPAKAMAKISCRLVPYQDDAAIEGMLRAYLEQHMPPTVTWTLSNHSHTPAVLVERDTPGVRAAVAALEATFGVKPLFRMEGGSVPVVSLTQRLLGVDSILMGFGLPDDNLHAPNEKLHLPNYYHGIESYIRFFYNLAK